jgi:hypothetical protein
MPDLLTEEELLALEEELAAREQQPVMLPQDEPTAPMIDFSTPVGAPYIRPPGPSVEFLRRQRELTPTSLPEAPEGWGRGVVDTFNPRTGVREEFSTISPPRRDSDYMEQIRNQINATEFKTQADALNAAIQFQHMREFQRLTDEGVPTEKALLQTGPGMFSKNPNVLAPLINATRPSMVPTVQDVDGVKVLRSGLRGERATAVPRSALETEDFKPAMFEVEGERVIQLGPNRFQYLGKPVTAKETPPAVRERIYKHQIEQTQQAIDQLPNALFNKGVKEQREQMEQRIKDINADLDAMVKPKSEAKAPSTERVTVISPEGKRGTIPRSQLDEAITKGYKTQ